MNDPQPKQSRLPSIDPGLASIVAAVLTLIGVVLTVVVQRDPEPAAETVVATTAVVTTAAPGLAGETSAPVADPVLAPTRASVVMAAASLEEQEAVRQDVAAMLNTARLRPLLVRDAFDVNDYGWPEGEEVVAGSGVCQWGFVEGQYHMRLESEEPALWCAAPLPRQAASFLTEMELTLSEMSRADLYFNYRISPDGQSFYSIGLRPRTQTLWVSLVEQGQNTLLLPESNVAAINTAGTNRLAVVVDGAEHALLINDELVAFLTDDRLATGTLGLSVTLREPNATETMILDNFELYGN